MPNTKEVAGKEKLGRYTISLFIGTIKRIKSLTIKGL